MRKVLLIAAGICFSVFAFAQDAAEKINQAQEAMKAKDYTKAYTLYDEAMSNLGDVQVDVSVNFNIGDAACKSGNVEGAEKYMGKAIDSPQGGTEVVGDRVRKCIQFFVRILQLLSSGEYFLF